MPFEIAPRPPICEPELAESLSGLTMFLRSLPPEKWDYSDLMRQDGCGTVGCALGWWKTIDLFNRGQRMLIARADGPRVWSGFFNNGQSVNRESCGPAMARGWKATSHDVADRIDHWLATGELV